MSMLMLSMVVFVSCSDDDSEPLAQLTVQLNSNESNVDFSTFIVTVTEARSGSSFTAAPLAGADKVVFSLPYGQYAIKAESKVNGVTTLYGAVENFTLSQTSTQVPVLVKNIQEVLEKTFVLDELFFNCSSNGDWDNNYYEEYFTIRNVSNQPLYADGLSFAICGDYNCLEDDGIKSSYLAKDSIIVSQIYTIPGNGTQYVVQPGESLVIAHSAIDHSANGEKPKARNLTGADFEIYVPYEYSMTTDNPDVPNVTVNYSMFQAFQWGYGGYAPLMLLRSKEDLGSYVQSHLRNMKVTGAYGNQMQNYLVIPTSWIIDGVEVASKDNMLHKVLPASVDRSYIEIDDSGLYGGFKGLFIQRKPAASGYIQDTNDSQNDLVVVPDGQKNYIK